MGARLARVPVQCIQKRVHLTKCLLVVIPGYLALMWAEDKQPKTSTESAPRARLSVLCTSMTTNIIRRKWHRCIYLQGTILCTSS